MMSIELIKLYSTFEESMGKEKALALVTRISSILDQFKQELTGAERFQEVENKIYQEIIKAVQKLVKKPEQE